MTDNISTITEALADFRAGRPIVVVDDEDRENEGDVVVAAEHTSPELVNFLIREARGLVCIAMTSEDIDRLGIPMMVPRGRNGSRFGSPFTNSVDASVGITTGISAHERARTIHVLADPASGEEDIVMPGHIFPLKAHDAGVLGRRGHTEAGVDLARLAGLRPAAVLCEIVADDGTMARRTDLEAFARKHRLKTVTIEAIARYRLEHEVKDSVVLLGQAELPTRWGPFSVAAYRDGRDQEHLLLQAGDVRDEAPLVRVHSECLTGDLLGSLRCDCGDQLHLAFEAIQQEEQGLLIYLRQEGRGIGLGNKIQAYALQDEGMDTVDANLCLGFPPDDRDYRAAAAMLRERGVEAVRLLTNNPQKVAQLERFGITVEERVPLESTARPENERYLRTKAQRMSHQLTNGV
jgi:3,4-dihydroxy 2-butanone 4-phosphate synthase/GTP cyclohydrolase II